MSKPYSQSKALWAITRASFKAIFNQPTALFFSLVFPLIFIMIFGAFGNDGPGSYKIALSQTADTTNAFYFYLKNNPTLKIVSYKDTATLNRELAKGKLTAIIDIKESKDTVQKSTFTVKATTTTASANTFDAFNHTLEFIKLKFESSLSGNKNEIVSIAPAEVKKVRIYRRIDFILPGQIGFSILFATLFGIAFAFYGLREQLVLKRFYASPIKRINILIGVGVSRLFFQLLNVIVLILFGHFLLNFTLIHGFFTILELLVITIVMLFLLMGAGLIISSLAKSDTNIPILVNLFGFPQMLLSGTFFPVEVFPIWLQRICRILPLTQFNDAIRKISFEGLHLWDCGEQLAIMAVWIIVIYFVLGKVLKWE